MAGGGIVLRAMDRGRCSSLSALVASFITPIFLWWLGHLALATLFAVLTVLLFYMHRANIARLQAGTEGRIGQKK
jgi:acyl phosphate:glycerol-3-phosphate acyltransferase